MNRSPTKVRAVYDKMQLRTFTRWWTTWLQQRGHKVEDLVDEVTTGVLPIVLFELLNDLPDGSTKYNRQPKMRFHMLENMQTFLTQVEKSGLKLVNIGAEDLVDGNVKLLLGVTWTLILKYEIQKFGANEAQV